MTSCPNCGSKKSSYKLGQHWNCICDKCGLVGPEATSRRAAELAWDEMKKESKRRRLSLT